MSASVGSIGSGHSASIALAKQALAKANAAVDADRQAHSPGCVACDQKLVDHAQQQLAAAQLSSTAKAGLPIDV